MCGVAQHAEDTPEWGRQGLTCVNQQLWGQKLPSIRPFQDYYQSFSGLTNYSKNFYSSWCCSNFQQISKPNPNHFQQVSKQFQTKSNQTSPMFKTLHPSYDQNDIPGNFNVKNSKQFLLFSCKLAKYFKFPNLPNLSGETKKFIEGSKVTRSNPKAKYLPHISDLV